MAIIYSHYKSTAATAWRWPLQVGIMQEDAALALTLHLGYWSSLFTEIKVLDQKASRVNILLFTKGIGNAVNHLTYNNWKADIVIILGNERDKRKDPDFIKAIGYILTKVEPSGLLVVSPETDLPFWFENLIIELSHDNNILQAVKPQSAEGLFFYDPKVEVETKLSNIIKGIIIGLDKGFQRPGALFTINSRIIPKQVYTPIQLANYLVEKVPYFRYDHESDTALGIAELTKVLYDRYSTGTFHLHVEQPEKSGSSADRGFEIKGGPGFGKITLPDYFFPEPEYVGGATAAPTAVEPTTPIPDAPRFLQVKILTATDRSTVENHLLPEKDYLLETRIGLDEAGWSHDPAPLDTGEIFKDQTVKEELIDILFRPLDGADEQRSTITLPRLGNSTIAVFTCKTGSQDYFTGEIEAVRHNNNKLLQKIKLQIRIRLADQDAAHDGLSTKLVYCTRSDFSNLSEGTHYDASYTYKERQGGASLSGMRGGKTLPMFFSPALAELMNEIKEIIQKAVMDIDKHPEDLFHINNVALLRKLAIKGNKLFVQHLNKHVLEGPLQIVTNRPGFVPLDFVYQLAPPAPDATLCPGSKEALEQGACKNCYDKTISPAPHVCPFGFWGFSQVIERSAMERDDAEPGDYLIKAQPTNDRRTLEILNYTLYASSNKVDAAVATTRKQVSDAITKYSVKAVESCDWDNWKKLTQEQNPDSMILIVHVEKRMDVNEDQVEIGDHQFLLQNYFDTSMIKPVQ